MVYKEHRHEGPLKEMSDEEEKEIEIETGEKDEEVYTKKGRAKLVEDDEIEPEEEGFMEGAEREGKNAKCRKCGKILVDEDFVEKEIDDEVMRFCSSECAEEYEDIHDQEKEDEFK